MRIRIVKRKRNGKKIRILLYGKPSAKTKISKSRLNKMRRRRQKRANIIKRFCYVGATLVASLNKDERRAINIR